MTASEACGTPDTPRHFLCAAGAAVGPGRAGSPAVPGRPGLEVGAASGTLTPPRVGCGALQSTLTPPVPTPVTSCGSVMGVGWVHQPTLSLPSVPRHVAPTPSKHNKEWKKNESNNKSRLGPPCC